MDLDRKFNHFFEIRACFENICPKNVDGELSYTYPNKNHRQFNEIYQKFVEDFLKIYGEFFW